MNLFVECHKYIAWIALYLKCHVKSASMVNSRLFFLAILSMPLVLYAQEDSRLETNLAGVFQEKTLFIQNPYNRTTKEFCIEEVQINGSRVDMNYRLSAIKIDFTGYDTFTPVNVRILHKDTLCSPIIINPEAVLFHTIFRFADVSLSDSALHWSTKGERGIGSFEVEKLYNGIWIDQEVIDGTGRYEGQAYSHYPSLDEGANKYRVRYSFPRGNRLDHLYSREVEFEFYPEPVEFKPKSAKTKLTLSRSTHYEIYDQGNTLVLEGQGSEIDVTVLRRGNYVIYFNGKDPGSFIKE